MQHHQKHAHALGCESCPKSAACYGVGSCSTQLVENFEPLEMDSTRGAYCCNQKPPHVRPIPNILNIGQCKSSGGYKSVWQPSECFDNRLVVENYTPPPGMPISPPVSPSPGMPIYTPPVSPPPGMPIPGNFIYQPTDYTNFKWNLGSSINGAGKSCCNGRSYCNGCQSCGNSYEQYFSNACYGNSCNF